MRRRTRWIAVGLLLALGVLGPLLLRVVLHHYRLHREFARLARLGEPRTADELNAFYRLPAEMPDGTARWLQGMALVERAVAQLADDSHEAIDVHGETFDEPRARDIVEACAEGLEALHTVAAEDVPARYPVDFSTGYMTLLPHAQSLRGVATLPLAEARLCALDGDGRGAARSLRTVFAMARSICNEPGVVEHLVRMAIDSSARGELEQLLSRVEFEDGDLAALQEDLRSIEYRTSAERALIGDRVLMLLAFDQPGTAGAARGPHLLVPLLVKDDRLERLQYYREAIAACRLAWPELIAATEGFAVDNPPDVTLPLRSIWTPPRYWDLFEPTASNAALNRAAETALGVVRYRQRQGRLPERLDQLVPEFLPELPLDPYTGEPCVYRIEEARFEVVSAGQAIRPGDAAVPLGFRVPTLPVGKD